MTRLLWVRQDWLDKLGLEAPRTVEDFIAAVSYTHLFISLPVSHSQRSQTVVAPCFSI